MEKLKKLADLYKVNKTLYFKVRARLEQGTMTRKVIDGNIYFYQSELETWKPKTAGRKAKGD